MFVPVCSCQCAYSCGFDVIPSLARCHDSNLCISGVLHILNVHSRVHQVRDLSLDLDEYYAKGIITVATKAAIEAVHVFEHKSNELTTQIGQCDAEIRELEKNQSRLRTNITTLTGHEEDSIQYIKDLKKNEEALQELQAKRKALEAERKDSRNDSSKAAHAINATYEVEEPPEVTFDD